MPLIGFEMNVNSEKQRLSLVEAIENPRKIGLPVMILAGIIKSVQDRGESISATTLTGCLRRTYWERTRDYFADPEDLLYKAFRGSMIHAILEEIATKKVQMSSEYGSSVELAINRVMSRYIAEKRFYRTIKIDGMDVELSSQPDLIEMIDDSGLTGRGLNGKKPRVVIHDYKTVEPYAVKKIGKEGLSEEHTFQVNFYAFLASPHFNVIGLKIHYIGFGFVASSGQQVTVKEFGRPTEVVLPEAILMSAEELLAMATPRIRIMKSAFRDKVVPPADPGNGGWRCKSCPFRSSCNDAILSKAKEAKKAENKSLLVGCREG